jgi:hypothetical protein
MKRLAMFLVLLVFAVPAHLSAQTMLGFHAGANRSNLGGDVEDADSRTGLNLGTSLTFSIGENLGLQTGASYAQKGATESEQGVDVTFGLDYLEIPVLLRYAFPTTGSVGVHVFGGGAVGIEVGCELEVTDGSATITVDCDEGEIETKTFDFGLVGGAGLSFDISESLELFVDLLYNLGLTSVDDSTDPDSVKNRALTVRAGLGLPLG